MLTSWMLYLISIVYAQGSINNLRLVTTHNSQVLRNVLAIRPGFIFPTCVARDVEASTYVYVVN